jgi:hypothetical protein
MSTQKKLEIIQATPLSKRSESVIDIEIEKIEKKFEA